MTLTVEDDFREFVAARWPDLEGVAFVVTLDAATARRVTTDALAALHQQWREALDEGRPGAAARRSVLSRPRSAARLGRDARRGRDRCRLPRHRSRPRPVGGPRRRRPGAHRARGRRARGDPPRTSPRRRAGRCGVPAPTRSPTCSGCRWPTCAPAPPPCTPGWSRPTTRPGRRRASPPRTGRSTSTSTASSSACSPARATRPTRQPSSRSAAGRCSGARWSPGAPPPSPPAPWLVGGRPRGPAPRRRLAGPPHRATPPAPRPELGERVALGRAGSARHRPAGAGARHQPLDRGRAPAVRRRRGRAAPRRLGDPQPGHRGRHRAGLAGPGRGRTRRSLQEVPLQSPFVGGRTGRHPARRADLAGHPAPGPGPAHRHQGGSTRRRCSPPPPAPSAAAGCR